MSNNSMKKPPARAVFFAFSPAAAQRLTFVKGCPATQHAAPRPSSATAPQNTQRPWQSGQADGQGGVSVRITRC